MPAIPSSEERVVTVTKSTYYTTSATERLAGESFADLKNREVSGAGVVSGSGERGWVRGR